MARKPYPEDQEKITIQDDWTEQTLFNNIANENYGVVFPFQASELESDFPEPDGAHQHEYVVVIGNDTQAWIYFWNRIFLLSGYRRSRFHTLCLAAESLRNQSYTAAVRRFITRFTFREGNSPPRVGLVSFDLAEEVLAPMRQELFDGLDILSFIQPVQANEFPAIGKEFRAYPEFDRSRTFFDREPTTQQQGTARKTLLNIPESPVDLSRGTWIMDVRVEQIPEFRFYSNEKMWWKVPRKREVARLFVAGPARVAGDYSISAEIHQKTVFDLIIPDEWSVLIAALGLGHGTAWTADLKLESISSEYKSIRLSDKGGYANGLISLFRGLFQAGHFFESSFWRGIAERLCRLSVPEEEAVLTRIRNKLDKQKAILSNAGAGNADSLQWLSRYVLQVARQQHMLDEEIRFPLLDKLFHAQREEYISRNPLFRPDNSEDAIKADRERVTRDLRQVLQYWTEAGVFLQGVRLHCDNCGSNYWQHVDDVAEKNHCHGCGADVALPVEAPWTYRLNSLVRNAIAFHGCMPLILTLYTAREFPTRHSFLFVPGIALYKEYTDKSPAAEIDFIAVADGKTVIGEVKTSLEEFSQKEITKLADLAKKQRPDVAILGCLRGDAMQLERRKAELEALLVGTGCAVKTISPGSSALELTPHP
jgi:hypothetical protein